MNNRLQLLTILLYGCFTATYADTVKHCRENVCQNGGTCMLTSPAPRFAKCFSNELYFEGRCYQIIRQAVNRTQATEHCANLLGGALPTSLVTIENDSERRFISQILQENVSKESKAYLSIAFWLGGQSNSQSPDNLKWYWPNSTEEIQRQFWDNNQPAIEDDINNLCMALDVDSSFASWKSKSCSDLNYFICQHPTFDHAEPTSIVQCRCPAAFEGRYCEIPVESTSILAPPPSSEQSTCESAGLVYACPHGGVILVDYAVYGHLANDTEMCLFQNNAVSEVLTEETCVDPSGLAMLTQRCEGLSFCQIPSMQSVFPHRPCPPMTPVTLKYRMRCSSTDNVPHQCHPGAQYIQGRCYSVELARNLGTRKTFDEARADCGLAGGDLARFQDGPVFSMLSAEIERQASAYNESASEELFWVKQSISTAKVSGFCPAVASRAHGLKLETCDRRLNWICEYPPIGEATSRKTESSVEDGLFVPIVEEIESTMSTMANNIETLPTVISISSTEATSTTTLSTSTLATTTASLPQAETTATAINHGPRAVCPEITWLGIRFPETTACNEAIVDCPDDDTTGIVRFKCGCEHGTWMNSADLSNCTHRWVSSMESDIESRLDSVEIATNMLTRLQTNVAEGSLYGGDVAKIVEASEQLVPLAHSQLANILNVHERIEYARNFTELMGRSGDELLSNGAKKAWEQLDTTRRVKKASNLMTVLELSLALLTDNMPAGQQALGFTNWASKVETKESIPVPTSFAVPRTRTASTASDSNFAPINATSRRYGPSTIVEFEGFNDAPIMQLPNFDILSASATPSVRTQSVASDIPQMFATAAAMPEASGPTKVGFFMYNSIGSLLSNDTSTIINSRVMGAFVNDPTVSVSLPANQPVNFTFYHLRTHGVANPRCVFWDPKYMTWSQNGCTMVETSEKYTQCSCNHLTSFAILMDVNDNIDMITGSNAVALDIITIFGCALSAVCLIATILIFTCFRSLYSVRHSIHRNLCMCLLAAEIFFVIGIDRTSNTAACRGVAIAMHYLFLAAFCWMLLEGYQLYMMLIQVFEPHKSRIYLYYLFGYGCPAIIVAVSAGITWRNYGTLNYCWINVRSGTIWAFIAPVIVVIVANLVVLGIALRVVLSVKSRERSTAQRIFGWLKGSATLLCLLGITWVFGFLAAIPGAHIVFAYVFCILNCFQGVLIFVLHCVLNDKVINALMRAARKSVCCCGPDLTSSSMAGYSSARTGTTFFSRHKLLNFFKHDTYQGSTHSTESTDSPKNAVPSPTPLTKSIHTHSEPLPKESPEISTIRRLSDWKSHTAASYQENQNQHPTTIDPDNDPYSEPQIPDRPTIRLPRPSIRPSVSSSHRNSNGSEVSLTPRRGLLRVDPDMLENRHSAPVKRKKFPLGSTEQERIAELRGGVITNPQSQDEQIVRQPPLFDDDGGDRTTGSQLHRDERQHMCRLKKGYERHFFALCD